MIHRDGSQAGVGGAHSLVGGEHFFASVEPKSPWPSYFFSFLFGPEIGEGDQKTKRPL